ncbi:MAG TPA: DNA polymerase domain-containing protein [Polyangiaceae bacterium]|jgi:DNA polymerase elongation subunit (family B)|nr:DNA polymerase domain-containing protein [Polyangiaceae bacterium]
MRVVNRTDDEWLWGWDTTPGIVSVWAEADGSALVWRRSPENGVLVRESDRFRPWLLLANLGDLSHLGAMLRREEDGAPPRGAVTYRELGGPGELRYLVRADDGRALARAVLRGAERRLGRPFGNVRDLGPSAALSLPPEEQYLVASGRTYFRDLPFDSLHRAQFDLETTGLDPETDRIFMVALRGPDGSVEALESTGEDDAAEAALIQSFLARLRVLDPDVIENHNLHGFDIPFLAHRARRLGVPVVLGRTDTTLRLRPAARGASMGGDLAERDRLRRARYTVPGRELIDSMDAVRRHDFSARDLPGHGLKAVARHFGLSHDQRELIPGSRVHEVYRSDPARVRRYALDDVHEAASLARLLGGSAFALAGMVPRRYERLADAGAATGVVDPLIARAYLREGAALPAHRESDGTEHTGAALHLFASGVAERVVKADVASLYPSLMRQYRIGPSRDRLGVFLRLVDRLVEQRLAAKARARAAPSGSPERFTAEALSAAMKLVVNSAYGYLGAASLTRFSDVHAANDVTRHGRAVLELLCDELARRGVTLLEADTDGVYFAVPPHWTESDERRVVSEVAALLPEQVHLEFEGRYAAMLSHEPKNYALLPYEGPLVLRGVAFRSSRAEPFGEAFLRRAVAALLVRDVAGVRAAYRDAVGALRGRKLPTYDVSSRVRLTKTPAEYLATRDARRELTYEAMLAGGRTYWTPGERVRVYRARAGRAGLLTAELEDRSITTTDARDYDVEFYVRILRDTYAARLARAFTPEDFATVFADPEQPSLFETPLGDIHPILTIIDRPSSSV